MREIQAVELKEETQIGAARRAVHFYANERGFSGQALSEIDLVVQEIGTNAVRYAGGSGRLHYTTPLADERGLELFYWDQGPGIYDLDRAVRDGVSSGGSLGGGLGAIKRQMDEFEIYSTVQVDYAGRSPAGAAYQQQRHSTHGTALVCRKWAQPPPPSHHAAPPPAPPVTFGAWSRPYPGEQANGDAYFTRRSGHRILVAVIDGLGHGRGAAQAALVACESLGEWADEPIDEVLTSAHQALKATRGAVIGAMIVDCRRRQLSYAGVGNIDVRIFGGAQQTAARFVPANGTLGLRLDRVRVWNYEWPEEESPLVVLASDGVSAGWDAASYPGLTGKDPQLLAGVLVRDYARPTDDATVLAARATGAN